MNSYNVQSQQKMHLSPKSRRNLNQQERYPNITGGGFVSTGPNVHFQRTPSNQVESAHVFDNSFKG
jgi:hypothetical protein